MDNFLTLLFLVSIMFLIIGLIVPSKVFLYGKKTRKNVCLTYGALTFATVVIGGSLAPSGSDSHVKTTQSTGYILQSKESDALRLFIRNEASAFLGGERTLLFENLPAVSAAEVAKAYEDNQVAADQKYYQKKLRIRGVIQSINSGLGNEPYIVFQGGNPFLSPQAQFNNPDIVRIAALKKGNSINLVCNGGIAIVGTATFDDCLFEDEYMGHEIAKADKKIHDFLSGKPQEDAIIFITIFVIDFARTLPQTSSCFSNTNLCKQELKSAISKIKEHRTTMLSVIEELKSKGVQISDTVSNTIESI